MTSLITNYTVEIEDLVAFNEDYFLKSENLQKRFRRERLFVLAPFVLGGIVLALIVLDASNSSCRYVFSIFMSMLCVAPGLLIYAFIPSSTQRAIRMRAKKLYSQGKNLALLGHQELILDSNTITARNEYSECKYAWEAVEKMSLTADHIFVYVSVGSAIIIPKQGIDKQQLQHMESFLEEKLKLG